MATSYYSTGTVSLTNGSAVVTGNGTGWQLALISGGNVIVQAPGNLLPIASVDSDTQITAELEWTGATGTYSYTIQRDTAYLQSLDQNSQNLSYLLSELRAGTIFKYDQSGDLAGRDLYDARPKNFGYLVTIGVSQPTFYVKASNTDGDWAGPFPYGTGPVGPQGPVGFLDFKGDYNPATAYVANDGVLYNGSSFVALQATTGNAPPTLPTTENAYWSLLAVKGADGSGTGDMQAATYDPQDIQADAFARANHTGDMPDAVLFADGDRKGRFDVGAVAVGQTRVYTMPDRDLVLNPAWEQIAAYPFTGVAAVDITDLSGFRQVRIIGSITPSVTSPLYLKTSTDNGATYDSGASDYAYTVMGIASTASGVASGDLTSIPLSSIGSTGPGVGAGMSFEYILSRFNQNDFMQFHGRGYNVDGANLGAILTFGQRSQATARNAIRIFPGSGTITGDLIVEGIR